MDHKGKKNLRRNVECAMSDTIYRLEDEIIEIKDDVSNVKKDVKKIQEDQNKILINTEKFSAEFQGYWILQSERNESMNKVIDELKEILRTYGSKIDENSKNIIKNKYDSKLDNKDQNYKLLQSETNKQNNSLWNGTLTVLKKYGQKLLASAFVLGIVFMIYRVFISFESTLNVLIDRLPTP